MSAFIEGFKRCLRDAWAVIKPILLLLAFLAFVSCAFYLDKLRFTV